MNTNSSTLKNDNIQKLSLFTKISYGLGDFASQCIWTFVGTYLTVFYTDVVGMAPAIASGIMLFARCWDAINDPMFGAIAERTRSRFGRFRPYILYGTPFLVLFNVLSFTTPFSNNSQANVIWAAVTYIILGMLYTCVNLSYGSLSTVMTYDPQERIELNSYRMIGTNLGAVLLNAISMPLLLKFSGVGDGATVTIHGYTMTAIVFSLISIPLFYLVFKTSKELVQPVETNKKVTLKKTAKVVLSNKPLLFIFFSMLFFMTAFFGRMGTVIYYYIYVMGRFDLISLLMTLPSLCAAVAIFVTKGFAQKLGKKNVIIIGYIGCAASLAGIYFTNPSNVNMIIILSAVYGIFNFATPFLMGSVPETIDYAEDKTGVRADGTSYAFVSLATKFGSAFGVSFGLLIMGAFGYIANAQQSVEAIKGINLAVNIGPAVLYLIAIIPILLYPLTEEKSAAVRSRLQEKASKNQNI